MRRYTFVRRIFCAANLLFVVLSFPLPAFAASPKGNTAPHTLTQEVNAPPNRQGWHIVPSPNIGTVGSQLASMSAVNTSNIWAVGYYYPTFFTNRTLVEHWNGSTWQVVPSPNVGTDVNFLYGVSALSANNVWAVGFYRNGALRTLIEHWNGTQWTVVFSPNVGPSHNQLEAVVALSPNNIWAVGTYVDVNRNANLTLIEHWDGTAWSVIPSPNTQETINDLVAIAAVSANNIWAVGYGETPGYITLVEHWDGSTWSIVKSPNIPNSNSSLQGLSVIAPNNIWAAGFYYDLNHNRDATLIEHWNGTTWSIVPSPNDRQDFCRLLAVAAVSANDIWAVGDDMSATTDDNGTGTFTLIEHWNGAKWEIVRSPSPSGSFNSLDSALVVSNKVWTAGYYFNNQTNYYKTLVEVSAY